MGKPLSFEQIKSYIEGEEGNGCKLLLTKDEFNLIYESNTTTKLLLKCKCGKEFEKVFGSFRKGQKQCKECGRNYTGTKNGYPESTKREALRYYTEGLGFRQIERLMHVSHVTVINWVKKVAEQLRRVEEEKKVEKEIEVIELDEMCISFKKTFGCGQQ